MPLTVTTKDPLQFAKVFKVSQPFMQIAEAYGMYMTTGHATLNVCLPGHKPQILTLKPGTVTTAKANQLAKISFDAVTKRIEQAISDLASVAAVGTPLKAMKLPSSIDLSGMSPNQKLAFEKVQATMLKQHGDLNKPAQWEGHAVKQAVAASLGLKKNPHQKTAAEVKALNASFDLETEETEEEKTEQGMPSMTMGFDLSKLKLIDAQQLKQPCHGASGTSTYYLVAKCTGLNLGIRRTSKQVSLRVEGSHLNEAKAALMTMGFKFKLGGVYGSAHLNAVTDEMVRKTVGAALGLIGPQNMIAACDPAEIKVAMQ